MSLWPLLYILTVVTLHGIALFSPLYSGFFVDTGYTAVIFTATLIGSHLAIFFPKIRPKHLFLLLPVLALSDFLLLTFYLGYGKTLFPGLYAGSAAPGFRLLDAGYDGLFKSLFLQSIFSSVVAIGLWMGRHRNMFHVRRAAPDQEEQLELFEFRARFLPPGEMTPYKYTTLTRRGLSLLGVRRNKIVSTINSLRLDDTLYIYDLLVDPALKERGIDTEMVRQVIHRPEIETSNIKEVVALVPDGMDEMAERFGAMGFTLISPGDSSAIAKMHEELTNILSHKFDDWKPFTDIKLYLRYTLPRVASAPAVS